MILMMMMMIMLSKMMTYFSLYLKFPIISIKLALQAIYKEC